MSKYSHEQIGVLKVIKIFPTVYQVLGKMLFVGLEKKYGWGTIPGGGELIKFYDGGDHVSPFSQTPNYVDQIFRNLQKLC